ncbi:MAG TPA: TonB-dependent receptor [Leeuwenhoekiella sp.]|uniref:TonB-dependent receptor n=1 Tax=Leeuwenhoekiella palythoae TaxID=573501 RepID=UPI000C5891EA|nr:TonB-dependent receptor [Leeuwenhoekiella palythoae]MBH11742.1 TonB-dependent receptor [Leeuwenhoekiella sp.]UBZ11602.1 TonB-dependent receptor [Leeuwenhoekiella palythoae]HAX14115.1 TonB-dependent receptor [Leeuwenhoekiella sp.]HBO30309.1 TonB-dependent receptor [Leeuwenhoekiella sp.]HCQ75172.1 TonB-dependent receptor [Leeuwenhoekiella sp.]
MKQILGLLMLMFSAVALGQTGTIEGTLSDKETNNEPLPFANVIIKGTTKGATTDFDGKYIIENVPVGTYEVEFSFVGYEPVTVPNVVVQAGKFTNVSTALGASAAALDEVVIQVQTSRERESALLLEQKKAVEIKESIGAVQLAKQGVTDAATATTKISGVTASQASGDIYVRGLGDRYLYTTMNGLPIPSDDVEKKNFDLGLFTTRVIQNVGISKTYGVSNSADQASGTIDVATKELSGTKELGVGIRVGANTNATQSGVSDNFKLTGNKGDYTLGFLKNQGFNETTQASSPGYSAYPRMTQQTWNTSTANFPMNYRYAITAGKKFDEKFKVLFTASQSGDFTYRNGVFRQYRENNIDDSITDATYYNRRVTTTGLLNTEYKINDKNDVRWVSLFVNSLSDQVFEGGRNGEATIFEEESRDDVFQFIRDQNTKQTRLWVNQFFGNHELSEKNTLDWGVGINLLSADEPNRVRNEVNITPDADFVQLGVTGGFQQRKSFQLIDDEELAGFIKDTYVLNEDFDTGSKSEISGGLNVRMKSRNFKSQFLGATESNAGADFGSVSIDNLDVIFTEENFRSGDLNFQFLPTDRYIADLESQSAFAAYTLQKEKFNLNVGMRFQRDAIDVLFDVNNFPGRRGATNKEYTNLYPSVNFKYNLTEDQGVRFAGSRTITLPEFKEIAPFEYVSPVGQVTKGNPDLEASINYNFDLKYEWFPSSDELLSVAAFYKMINDPINKVQQRGSAGIFSYFNAGDQANIFGLELEGRVNIVKPVEDSGNIGVRLSGNITRMFHEQDLKEIYDENGTLLRTFKYNGKSDEGLQGASDWIVNGTLGFSTAEENPWELNVVGNYASSKIFALGAPRNQQEPDVFFNESIVEQGFVVLDAVLSKQVTDGFAVKLTGRNLLDPAIEQTQIQRPTNGDPVFNATVQSYTLGRTFLLGLTYDF